MTKPLVSNGTLTLPTFEWWCTVFRCSYCSIFWLVNMVKKS